MSKVIENEIVVLTRKYVEHVDRQAWKKAEAIKDVISELNSGKR